MRYGRLGYPEDVTRLYAGLNIPEPPELGTDEMTRNTVIHSRFIPALVIIICREDVDRWDGAPVADNAPVLGQRYRDQISGWEGTATAVTHHLDGTWTAEISNGADTGPVSHWVAANRLTGLGDDQYGFRP